MADNTVTIVGNLTRDPELRFTASGQGIATLGVAVNRVWNDRATNERKENTSFFNVTCWGQLGENVASSLSKGHRVMVTGRLEQRTYETQQGEKRSVVDIVADEVAPSLRWATCEITRNERKEGGGDFGGGGGRQVQNDPQPIPAGAGLDEEPF